MIGNRRIPGVGRSALDPSWVTIGVGMLLALCTVVGCEARGHARADSRPAEASFFNGFATRVPDDDSSLVLRRVWAGQDVDVYGGASVSADGRYVTFIDWTGTGDVMVRDVTTGEVERVTHDGVWDPYQTAEEVRISPDGRDVAYLWFSDEDNAYNHYEIRLIRRGEREPRLLYRSSECDYPQLWGWSPDGSELLFLGYMKDGKHRLMAVRARDASLRQLADFGTAEPAPGVIAPAARYVAYTLKDEEGMGDIFVRDLESGNTVPLVTHPANDYVLGWAPDGDHVLFASDRSGILGAWLQAVEDGRPKGEPTMVKANLWRAEPIGFTADGAFFFGVPLNSRKVYVATLDPGSGAVLTPPSPLSGDYLTFEDFPVWSPDGRYLAYRTAMDDAGTGFPGGKFAIVVRSLDTGDTRQVTPDVAHFGNFCWYPDGRHLLVDGLSPDDEWGLYRIDIETGQGAVPETLDGVTVTRLIDLDPGGHTLFYRARRPEWEGSRPLALDMATGHETVLHDGGIGYFPGLSPDGRYLAFAADDGDTPALMVVPTDGGATRIVVRFEGQDSIRGEQFIRGITWTPDGQTLLYARVGSNRPGIWRVPVAGGEPQKIDLSVNGSHPNSFRDLRLNPDGRHLAFDLGKMRAEVWVMEDFLPEPEP
jgi:Tol biopolymer transport system component